MNWYYDLRLVLTQNYCTSCLSGISTNSKILNATVRQGHGSRGTTWMRGYHSLLPDLLPSERLTWVAHQFCTFPCMPSASSVLAVREHCCPCSCNHLRLPTLQSFFPVGRRWLSVFFSFSGFWGFVLLCRSVNFSSICFPVHEPDLQPRAVVDMVGARAVRFVMKPTTTTTMYQIGSITINVRSRSRNLWVRISAGVHFSSDFRYVAESVGTWVYSNEMFTHIH